MKIKKLKDYKFIKDAINDGYFTNDDIKWYTSELKKYPENKKMYMIEMKSLIADVKKQKKQRPIYKYI